MSISADISNTNFDVSKWDVDLWDAITSIWGGTLSGTDLSITKIVFNIDKLTEDLTL